MNKQELVKDLLGQAKKLPYRNQVLLDSLIKKSEMYIRNIFGENSKYLGDLKQIHFSPMIFPADENYYDKSWKSGVSELTNLFETMLEELTLFGSTQQVQSVSSSRQETAKVTASSNEIFVVHGHNDGLKNEVARFLEKLDLDAVILHERPNNGKTVIEKFESESSRAEFAVVLLSGDDQGTEIGNSENLKLRARQNVVFEFGYFISALGRSKVVALVEEGVELPSDYSGVVYIPFDKGGAWKLYLAKELKNSGLNVDLNLAV